MVRSDNDAATILYEVLLALPIALGEDHEEGPQHECRKAKPETQAPASAHSTWIRHVPTLPCPFVIAAWMGLDGVMMSWTAVIPVKRLETAKSRLGATDDPQRPELALAFALDVIDACLKAPSISAVIVVTDDQEVIDAARGVSICPEPVNGGLNRAIAEGAALVEGPIVALTGDLPCLTPESLEYVLGLASQYPHSLLSDAQGSGTAMLLAIESRTLKPHFGTKSRSEHVQAGYIDLALETSSEIRTLIAGARRDVDTPADLWDALRIGVGSHTSAVIGRQS